MESDNQLQIPDRFVYSYLHPPFHIVPWDKVQEPHPSIDVTIQLTTPYNNRKVYSFIETFRKSGTASCLVADFVLPTGQTLAEFSICSQLSGYEKRRANKTHQRKKKRKIKEEPTTTVSPPDVPAEKTTTNTSNPSVDCLIPTPSEPTSVPTLNTTIISKMNE